MRRASSLLSNLTTSNLFPRNLITNLFSHFAPQNPFPISPLHLKSLSFLPSTPPNSFPKCPHHRSIQTLPSTSLPLNPNLFESLESAKTTEEILSAFESLESYLKVGEHLNSVNSDDLLKALNFALIALKIFERDDGGSILVAKTLRLMGSMSCKLEKFYDSLDSLNTADKILDRLEKERFGDSAIGSVSIEVQLQLADTNTAMGRRWDALINLRRALELRKLILGPNSQELGAAYKDLAEAYAVVSDFKEALPLCLKALEILKVQFGHNSAEVAQARQLLGVIYVGLGENVEALEQNELSRGILKSLDLEAELLDLEIEAANIKIAMGRLGEAIETLKSVIQRADKESETRVLMLVSMAKALCGQEKFGDSKRCLEISCGVLDKLEPVSSPKVLKAYAEISMLYEMMNEFETALSLMKRTLAILEKLPREQHLEGSISARMGWLLLLTGRAPQALTYLQRAVQRLEISFGRMHFGLGFVYKHLGQAYLEIGKPSQAVLALVSAHNILDRWFGPQHEDSIDACQCLANAYAAKASISPVEFQQSNYAHAMEFQQRVIDRWESHGPDARDELREAHRLFEQLKKKAQGSPSAVFPANTLPLPQQK